MYLSDTPLRIIISNNSNKEYEIITVIHLFINNKIYSLKFFSSKPYCNIFHLFVDLLIKYKWHVYWFTADKIKYYFPSSR